MGSQTSLRLSGPRPQGQGPAHLGGSQAANCKSRSSRLEARSTRPEACLTHDTRNTKLGVRNTGRAFGVHLALEFPSILEKLSPSQSTFRVYAPHFCDHALSLCLSISLSLCLCLSLTLSLSLSLSVENAPASFRGNFGCLHGEIFDREHAQCAGVRAGCFYVKEPPQTRNKDKRSDRGWNFL